MPTRSCLEELQPGDYVIYLKFDKCELGRIVTNNPISRRMKVCYHGGCTAATTDYDNLALLENQSCITETTFGFGTFDEMGCSYYDACPYPHAICKPCEVQ